MPFLYTRRAAISQIRSVLRTPAVTLASDFELIIGARIVQKKYGAGVVSDVLYDESGKVSKFTVTFDSGEEKVFAFPIAFLNGMRLESS